MACAGGRLRARAFFNTAMHKLTPSVRACIDQDMLVFLDLKRDQYLTVDLAAAPEIDGIFQGGQGTAASSLVARGIIEETEVFDAPRGGSAPPIDGEMAPQAFRDSKARPADALIAFYACARASLTVRSRRLDLAFRDFGLRKRVRRTPELTPARAAACFELLRPWYPRARVCLFDLLALMNFLLARGHAPTLVVGIRAKPFVAHCWVEESGVCLTDAMEVCRSYTPIAWA